MLSNSTHPLEQALQSTELDVIGHHTIWNEAQEWVGAALLQAFHGSDGFLYFEVTDATDIDRPGDVLFCHPEIGLLVIEVKAFSLEFIQRIQGNHLIVQYRNRPIPSQVNPFEQARQLLFRVKNRTQFELYHDGIRNMPLFYVAVAMPNISSAEWKARGFGESFPLGLMLFREHIDQPERLRQRLLKLADSRLQKSNRTQLINLEHIAAVRRAVGDSDAIHVARPPRDWVTQDTLGGQIDQMYKAERHISPEQLKLSNLPINGHPRLIRGVAGSGKSLVLGCI